MAVDRQRIVDALAQRNFVRNVKPAVTRLQVKQSAQTLSDAEWDIILTAYKTGNNAKLGEVISENLDIFLLDIATTEVDTVWLADNALSLEELDLFI